MRKHGSAKTALYKVWGSMEQRCNNPSCEAFPLYGARGISVCERWMKSYITFRDDVLSECGEAAGASIDRIDNNGNYEPGNVRWATWKEQATNRRPRPWGIVTYKGEVTTIKELSRKHGVNYWNSVRDRLAVGIPHTEKQALINKDSDLEGKGNEQTSSRYNIIQKLKLKMGLLKLVLDSSDETKFWIEVDHFSCGYTYGWLSEVTREELIEIGNACIAMAGSRE